MAKMLSVIYGRLLSTNLHTGVALVSARAAASSLLLALATQLLLCVLLTLGLGSLLSAAPPRTEAVIVTLSRALRGDAVWCQAVFTLVSLLGLATILTKLTVPMAVIEKQLQAGGRQIPATIAVGLIILITALSSAFSQTEKLYSAVCGWGLDTASLIVGAGVQGTVVWGPGLAALTSRLAARGGGGAVGGARAGLVCLQLAGVAAPPALLLLAALTVWTRLGGEDRAAELGIVITVLVVLVILVPATFITVRSLVRGRRSGMAWRQILSRSVLGRGGTPDQGRLSNSYRKFERCDITLTNMARLSPMPMPSKSRSGTLHRRSPNNKGSKLSY